MADLTAQPEEKKNVKARRSLPSWTKIAVAAPAQPLCELHCPVENCINLLYEETPLED